MARNRRNMIFLSVVCLLLLIPGSGLLVQKGLANECPEWLSSERADYLVGGVQSASPMAHVSLDGFVSGRFQDSLETVIGRHIPGRAEALLMDGALNRLFIDLSNTLFQWECYPTFYGSERLYVPAKDALVRMPEQDKTRLIEGVRDFAKGLSCLAADYSDKDFLVVLPDISDTASCNPAMALVSDPVDLNMVIAELEASLRGVGNVRLVAPAYDDFDAYLQDYYSTDHHWNGFGAYRAYFMSEVALGREEVKEGASANLGAEDALDGLIMNGSLSREGLMLLDEPIHEPCYRADALVVEEGDIPALLEGGPGVFSLYAHELRTEFDFYHIWYGPSSPNKLSSAKGSESALLVCDSFGSALRWFLGARYENTSVVLDLYGSNRGNETLGQRIEDSGADVVYLNASAYNISRFTDRYPRYFAE